MYMSTLLSIELFKKGKHAFIKSINEKNHEIFMKKTSFCLNLLQYMCNDAATEYGKNIFNSSSNTFYLLNSALQLSHLICLKSPAPYEEDVTTYYVDVPSEEVDDICLLAERIPYFHIEKVGLCSESTSDTDEDYDSDNTSDSYTKVRCFYIDKQDIPEELQTIGNIVRELSTIVADSVEDLMFKLDEYFYSNPKSGCASPADITPDGFEDLMRYMLYKQLAYNELKTEELFSKSNCDDFSKIESDAELFNFFDGFEARAYYDVLCPDESDCHYTRIWNKDEINQDFKCAIKAGIKIILNAEKQSPDATLDLILHTEELTDELKNYVYDLFQKSFRDLSSCSSEQPK